MLLCVVAAGCSTGPVTVRRDRFNFNDAGAESTKEQILLNIVRLRYGETLYFVDIGTMVSHYTLGTSGGLSGYNSNMEVWDSPTLRAIYGMRGEPPQKHQTWDANLSYTDSPTISYTPLTGEEFSKRVMAPIPPATIIYLSESGWSIDRLLDCCVQRINDVQNSPIHESDQSSASKPDRFRRLTELLEKAQDAGYFRFGIEYDEGQSATYLYVPEVPAEWEPEQKELAQLLGISPGASKKVLLTGNAVRREPNEVAMQTRSLLAVMYALSAKVSVPSDHLANGQVSTRPSGGDPQSSRDWLRIRHSRLPQVDPFVQVFYNGYWFYIDKSAWSSKRTFALLTYLFSLQSSARGQTSPVLTVPAGG